MAEIFARKKLSYDITIRARFGTTVCALVKAGLGIAVIDQFTVAHGGYPGIELLRIVEPTKFDTYIAVKRGAPLSLHIEHFIDCLRSEMRAVGPARRATKEVRARGSEKINMMLCLSNNRVIVLEWRCAIVAPASIGYFTDLLDAKGNKMMKSADPVGLCPDRILTGLLGAPIAHSASPAMHERAAEALGLRCHYQLIEVAGAGREELKLMLEGVRRLGFAGINVTFPYKEAVLDLLDELSPRRGTDRRRQYRRCPR